MMKKVALYLVVALFILLLAGWGAYLDYTWEDRAIKENAGLTPIAKRKVIELHRVWQIFSQPVTRIYFAKQAANRQANIASVPVLYSEYDNGWLHSSINENKVLLANCDTKKVALTEPDSPQDDSNIVWMSTDESYRKELFDFSCK
jgi:hypothetical protein